MTPPSKRKRHNNQRGSGRGNLWRTVPAPPEPGRIRRADDAGALLRSLGPPPLFGHSAHATHYLTAVAERAATMAAAVASSAGLLDETDEDG